MRTSWMPLRKANRQRPNVLDSTTRSSWISPLTFCLLHIKIAVSFERFLVRFMTVRSITTKVPCNKQHKFIKIIGFQFIRSIFVQKYDRSRNNAWKIKGVLHIYSNGIYMIFWECFVIYFGAKFGFSPWIYNLTVHAVNGSLDVYILSIRLRAILIFICPPTHLAASIATLVRVNYQIIHAIHSVGCDGEVRSAKKFH